MYNQELYEIMLKEFGEIGMLSFSWKLYRMYDILYEDLFKREVDGCYDYVFEREWWKQKAQDLETKLKFD